MRKYILLVLVITLCWCMACSHSDWIVLFDGSSVDAWRAFKRTDFPEKGWQVVDGTLKTIPKPKDDSTNTVDRVDLVTKETFKNFELELEWKVSPGGNSGIFYNVSEDVDKIWYAAPEMQVLDNERHKDGKKPQTCAGSLYALIAPNPKKVLPVGQYNHVRLIVNGDHVEHWLNHRKVVSYELGSDKVKALIAESKFSDKPLFMTLRQGHIGLQHHGQEVWYRNIRIRRLGE